MRSILRILSGFTACLILSTVVFAQSQATTGVIQGTVYDQSGAVVPGATVVIRNTATGFQRTVTSNSGGGFTAPLLPLGNYTVTANASGFVETIVENLKVTIGQIVSVRVDLKAAGQTTTVDVELEGGLPIDVQQTELSTQINERAVENLPISRRDFSKFVQLTPGVSIVQGPDGDEITINGQKGIQNNFSIDGSDANNPFFGEQRGGQRPAFTVSLEAIQEFQVVPVGASAEFGRSSGGFINAVTKSGTNEFSGSAFLFFRNDNLSAVNSALADASEDPNSVFFGIPKEESRTFQFGGNLGGPIVKDKAFFFAAYERNDGRSDKENRIDPTLVTIFANQLGSPGEQGLIRRTDTADVLLLKGDFNINDSNLLTVRHNYSRAEQVNGTFDFPTWGASANGRETDNSNSFIVQLVTTFTSNLLNEFRFQYAKEERPRFYDGPDLPDITIGTFDGSTSYRFGRPFFLPVPSDDTRFQFTNNITYITGDHLLKFGADINRVKVSQTFIGFARGRYIFAAPTFAAALTGFQNYLDQSDPSGLSLYLQFAPANAGTTVEEAGTQAYSNFEPGIYAQDTWNVRPNLTLNLGFRWEGQYQPDIINPIGSTAYGNLVSDPNFPSDGTIPDFTDGYQPRLGLSWSPGDDGKTAIRLGAGVYYARIPGLVVAGPRNTDGSIAGNIYRDGSFCTFGGGAECPVLPGILPLSAFNNSNPGIAVFERNFKNPRTVQFSASIEREIAPQMTFLFAYNFANTDRLTRFVNRNDPALNGGTAPFPTLGEIRSTESSARSRYQGLTFTLNKRFSDKYQFQVNYLASWDKSDDDNERDPFTFRYADVNNFVPEYNYSDRDQRHRFNAFATFELPYEILISPIVQYRSAQPLNRRTPGSGPSPILRNDRRKDITFFTVDFRASKVFKLTEKVSLEGIFEAFNLFNRDNIRSVPGSLTFNFDGTLTAGFGDPRQAQFGLRLKF
ncbi:MAG: TonB-dependent receptor [Pyrinomonadaceae bacterium]|nr:TonB-dependent receptor [Pyrinomonadaceae bacterium]